VGKRVCLCCHVFCGARDCDSPGLAVSLAVFTNTKVNDKHVGEINLPRQEKTNKKQSVFAEREKS